MLQQMSSTMEKQLSELTARIYGAAGMEFNINSPRQLGEILFEKAQSADPEKDAQDRGVQHRPGSPGGASQTYELPKLILDYRQMPSSNPPMWMPSRADQPAQREGPHDFNQTGAANRPSVEFRPEPAEYPHPFRHRAPDPRRIRSREGKCPDFSRLLQVELRRLAHLSQDDVWSAAFRSGEDIHERTAREVFSEPSC